ncbi:Cardiotrophin-2 [Microtus ochrogaster]|uniref:Cardiotrophin-2 n=1 Tax=Microtus ochrogaster TaxID=79684 RepID=A0A8J6L3G7_MICOH|nr:Cardiotrophin-2 [Microtus ochrogaster]
MGSCGSVRHCWCTEDVMEPTVRLLTLAAPKGRWMVASLGKCQPQREDVPPRNSFSHFPSICLSLMQLQYQGSPFSDPGFSAPELQLSSLPPAAVSFKIWHAMDDAERLRQAQGAFLALTQHLQLVGDDQSDLNPGTPILLAQLGAARLRAQGLLGNMAAIMTALGLSIPPEEDTLGLVPFGASAFERKCRGYIVTREYGHWTDRAVRDLALLKAKYPA